LKILLGLSVITIILFAQTTSVAAINDQGLMWGVEINDRFDYNVELEFQDSTTSVSIDERMYAIINELEPIPDHVTILSHLTIFRLSLGSYTTYWENGTIMDSFWIDVVDLPNPFVVYPIGNWSLISQIFEDAAPVIITQNTTVMNYSLLDFPVLGNVHETIFLKSSGVPLSNQYIRTYDSGATIHMNLTKIETPATTETNTGDSDSTLILIIGGGALVATLVIVVIIRRK